MIESDIAANFVDVRNSISAAAKAAGRAGDDITLVAVSKKQPAERIDAALKTGHRVFGENQVQEAQARWSGRRPDLPGLELRMVGPLQSNKTADAVALFDVIESLDREKLARSLAREAQRQSRSPRLYVQVNTGEEPQKAGIAPQRADAFIDQARNVYGLSIEGLMCIPPLGESPSMHFALLAKIAERNGVEKLSMGMSGDFETAIRYGATSVRIGTALFGRRPQA